MNPEPKVQAFLEDLVAVYAKHGLRLGGYPWANVEDLEPGLSALSVQHSCLDIGHHDAQELEALMDEPSHACAIAPIPTTAHDRLKSAARVARLRAEGVAA